MDKYLINDRMRHFKLHLKCLIKTHISFLNRDIPISLFFNKSWFFTKGLFRSINLFK